MAFALPTAVADGCADPQAPPQGCCAWTAAEARPGPPGDTQRPCAGEEDTMTRAETEAYRQRLLALMKRLDRDESQLRDEALQATGGEASGGLSDIPLHPADLGTHQFEEDLTLSLLENEGQLVGEIAAALARIEQGTFGRCEKCHGQIAKGRLQAIPYARHCAACARELEGQART
jgi:RNA polymerase-binding transcription factor DksA